MLRTCLVSACLLGLTACGGGGKSALIDACVEQGDSRKDCACMADKLEEGLSPQAFDAMVLSAQGKDKEAEAAMKELGMGDAMKVAGTMMAVVAECGVTGFGK